MIGAGVQAATERACLSHSLAESSKTKGMSCCKLKATPPSSKREHRDTPRRLPLTPPLTRNTWPMTQGSNAGIKRNRRPAGIKSVERKIHLDPDTAAALAEACQASGQLSMSLYLERLVSQLKADLGGLPVLSPAIDGTEVHTKGAD
jgi:hypothetical protein